MEASDQNAPQKEGMSEWLRKVLESKRRERARLAALPFSEKLLLLEKLRDRSLALADNPLRRDKQNR